MSKETAPDISGRRKKAYEKPDSCVLPVPRKIAMSGQTLKFHLGCSRPHHTWRWGCSCDLSGIRRKCKRRARSPDQTLLSPGCKALVPDVQLPAKPIAHLAAAFLRAKTCCTGDLVSDSAACGGFLRATFKKLDFVFPQGCENTCFKNWLLASPWCCWVSSTGIS